MRNTMRSEEAPYYNSVQNLTCQFCEGVAWVSRWESWWRWEPGSNQLLSWHRLPSKLLPLSQPGFCSVQERFVTFCRRVTSVPLSLPGWSHPQVSNSSYLFLWKSIILQNLLQRAWWYQSSVELMTSSSSTTARKQLDLFTLRSADQTNLSYRLIACW